MRLSKNTEYNVYNLSDKITGWNFASGYEVGESYFHVKQQKGWPIEDQENYLKTLACDKLFDWEDE